MAAVALAVAMSSCGSSFNAVEDVPGPVEVRIVVTFSAEGRSVRALVGTEPFRRNLKTLFDDDDTLEVWVFAYTRATLVDHFPAFDGMLASEITPALAPQFDQNGFEPPIADRVLTTTIDSGTSKSVTYESTDWAGWLQQSQTSPRAPFSLHVAPALACPQTGQAFRMFTLDDAASACPAVRDAQCGWDLSQCDGERVRAMCPAARATRPVELPNRRLRIGDGECAPTDVPRDVLGVSATWQCPAGVCGSAVVNLAAQDPQSVLQGSSSKAWAPVFDDANKIDTAGGEVQFGGIFTRVDKGAVYAYEDQSVSVRFRRLAMTRVGASALDVPADSRLEVSGTSLTVRQSQVGALRRLTVDRDARFLVLHGSDATYIIDDDDTDPNGVQWQTPRRVAHDSLPNQETLIGEIVASRRSNEKKIYAAVTGGIAVLDKDTLNLDARTMMGPTLSATVSHRLSVMAFDQTERVALCAYSSTDPAEKVLCTSQTVHLFDANAGYLGARTVPGDILAFLDGGRVLYRRARDSFELSICNIVSGVCTGAEPRILVPPSDAAGGDRVAVQRDAIIELGDGADLREMIVFSYAKHVGAIDVATGFSIVSPPRNTAGTRSRVAPIVFANRLLTQAWLVAADPDDKSRLDRIGLPLLRDSSN